MLGFSTRLVAPPEHATVALLSGVVATSPLIRLTSAAPKLKRWVGEKVSTLLPNMNVPAETKAEVRGDQHETLFQLITLA